MNTTPRKPKAPPAPRIIDGERIHVWPWCRMIAPDGRDVCIFHIDARGDVSAYLPTTGGTVFVTPRYTSLNQPPGFTPAAPVEPRTVVYVANEWEAGNDVARLAMELSGRSADALHRGPDGLLTCPHCRKRYKVATCFRNHLRHECKDGVAAAAFNTLDVPAMPPGHNTKKGGRHAKA